MASNPYSSPLVNQSYFFAGAPTEKRPRTEENQECTNISQTPESESESVSPRSPVGKKAKTESCQNSNAEWVKKVQIIASVKLGRKSSQLLQSPGSDDSVVWSQGQVVVM